MGCICSSEIVVFESYADKYVIQKLPTKNDIVPYLSKLSGVSQSDIMATNNTSLNYTLYTVKDLSEQHKFVGLLFMKVLYVYRVSDALPLWSMIHTLLELIPITKNKLPREIIQALGAFATMLARGQ
jgi:hypothetical protein